jgi:hypothetical protein
MTYSFIKVDFGQVSPPQKDAIESFGDDVGTILNGNLI